MAMYTVPRLAKAWGVAPKKIRDYIDAGELEAVNLASVHSRRERLAISEDAIESFLARRAVGPKVKPVRKKRSTVSARDYFVD